MLLPECVMVFIMSSFLSEQILHIYQFFRWPVQLNWTMMILVQAFTRLHCLCTGLFAGFFVLNIYFRQTGSVNITFETAKIIFCYRVGFFCNFLRRRIVQHLDWGRCQLFFQILFWALLCYFVVIVFDFFLTITVNRENMIRFLPNGYFFYSYIWDVFIGSGFLLIGFFAETVIFLNILFFKSPERQWLVNKVERGPLLNHKRCLGYFFHQCTNRDGFSVKIFTTDRTVWDSFLTSVI